jgi:hypothetical protein
MLNPRVSRALAVAQPRMGATTSNPARRTGVPHLIGNRSERARLQLVRAVWAIYLLAIFEGVLRKYVAPQFGQFIFFIRDPFLIYAYFLATRFKLWPRGSVLLKVSLGMAVGGALLLLVQSAVGSFSETRLLLGGYGWRNYFLYIPLACVVGAQFRTPDLLRFARVTLWLSVPIALLVALQFASPPDAPINVGFAAEKELQFKGMTVTADRVRTTGPFTSTAGQQQFVATAFALLVALLLLPATRRRMGLVALLIVGGGVLSCVGFSGARGTVLQCGLAILFALLIGVLGRGVKLKAKAIYLPLALATVAVVLYPIFFPDALAAFLARWNQASADEARIEGGVFGRALLGFTDFIRLIGVVPALGYGLGYGGNASFLLGATIDGVMPSRLAETDFSRHMVDLGPLLGMGFIAFRFALAIWLAQSVLKATRRAPDALPMMLFSYAGYVVLLGQITGNGTINVYGWLFVGLTIAASREALLSAGKVATAPWPSGLRTMGSTSRSRQPRARRPAMDLPQPP